METKIDTTDVLLSPQMISDVSGLYALVQPFHVSPRSPSKIVQWCFYFGAWLELGVLTWLPSSISVYDSVLPQQH